MLHYTYIAFHVTSRFLCASHVAVVARIPVHVAHVLFSDVLVRQQDCVVKFKAVTSQIRNRSANYTAQINQQTKNPTLYALVPPRY
jgi:hypothetical protein